MRLISRGLNKTNINIKKGGRLNANRKTVNNSSRK